MKILGIHDGHNASACLYQDGQVAAAIQEERLRREKNWSGLPTEAPYPFDVVKPRTNEQQASRELIQQLPK